MLRTIFWYAAGWTYLFVTMPALLRLRYLERKGRISEKEELAGRFSMMLARGLFKLSGSTLELTGLEKIPDGPVLFVSNHQSHMDNAVIHGYINKRKGFVDDKDAANIPIIRTWMKYMNCIFIDRKNAGSNISSLERGINLLRTGHSLVIYPEGRINASSRLIEFKKGCVKLAVKAEVPIVPITLDGSGKVMSRKGFVRSAHVKCIISDPIYITRHRNADEKALIKKVKEIIANNLSSSIQ
jgi:1-acyl-sn-glycerol-3-phosphate acyltransferase